jgi:hypothetical protein
MSTLQNTSTDGHSDNLFVFVVWRIVHKLIETSYLRLIITLILLVIMTFTLQLIYTPECLHGKTDYWKINVERVIAFPGDSFLTDNALPQQPATHCNALSGHETFCNSTRTGDTSQGILGGWGMGGGRESSTATPSNGGLVSHHPLSTLGLF